MAQSNKPNMPAKQLRRFEWEWRFDRMGVRGGVENIMAVDSGALRQQSATRDAWVSAKVAELADAPDLGSGVLRACGFNSRPSHECATLQKWPVATTEA